MSKKRSPEVKKLYRKVARQNHKLKCIVTKSTKKLTIHHCDGNWHNNSPENLCYLSEPVHRRLHAGDREIQNFVELYQKWWILENSNNVWS